MVLANARARMLVASMAMGSMLLTSSRAFAEDSTPPATIVTASSIVSRPATIAFRKGEVGGSVMFLFGVATIATGLVLGGIALAQTNDDRRPGADANGAGSLVVVSIPLLVVGSGLVVGGVLLTTRSE